MMEYIKLFFVLTLVWVFCSLVWLGVYKIFEFWITGQN